MRLLRVTLKYQSINPSSFATVNCDARDQRMRGVTGSTSELSMGWVDPWVGLGRDFSVFRGLGWVHYSKSIKFERISLLHLKHG